MKSAQIIILFCLVLSSIVHAQATDSLPDWRLNQLHLLQQYVKNDNVLKIAELIKYPISRPAPIPEIKDQASFILYYPILFDDILKDMLTQADFGPHNTIDRYDGFGLGLGFLWLDKNGQIIGINYSSEKELELKSMLSNSLKSNIHPSVNTWKENIFVLESEKFLIRLDLLDYNNYRYISWSKPKVLSEEPDLILVDRDLKYHGTMGGVTYTFNNSNWKYIIDQVDSCCEIEQCGLFLILLKNDIEILNVRLTEVDKSMYHSILYK